MIGDIDSDKSGAIQPILNELLRMRYAYNCGMLIVHHSGKRNINSVGRRAGQRLLGSTSLHAFNESGLYTSHLDDHRDGWSGVMIEREFRSFEPQTPVRMAWHIGADGMEIDVTSQNREGLIVETVRERGKMKLQDIVVETGLGEKTIRRYADKNPLLTRTRGRGTTTWVQFVPSNGASPNFDDS